VREALFTRYLSALDERTSAETVQATVAYALKDLAKSLQEHWKRLQPPNIKGAV